MAQREIGKENQRFKHGTRRRTAKEEFDKRLGRFLAEMHERAEKFDLSPVSATRN